MEHPPPGDSKAEQFDRDNRVKIGDRIIFVADARKPDSVDHFTFRDLAPGEESAIPQPIAIDFGPEVISCLTQMLV